MQHDLMLATFKGVLRKHLPMVYAHCEVNNFDITPIIAKWYVASMLVLVCMDWDVVWIMLSAGLTRCLLVLCPFLLSSECSIHS